MSTSVAGPLYALGLVAFFASGITTFASRRLAQSIGAVDHPTGGRKIHQRTTPLLGGVGIGAVLLTLIAVGWMQGFAQLGSLPWMQLVGFVTASVLIIVIGVLDDVMGLPASSRFGAYALACALVVLTGTTISKVSRLSGGAVDLPAWLGSLLTFGWMLGVTFAVKVMDGLDGLVTGQTVIGSGLIAGLALTAAFFQPTVAALAVIVGASFAGFLPYNVHPARQFLGESGSALAGFSLAFLAVVSGAKVATAFMALGLPLVDMVIVMIGRLARGVSPLQGDDTHLHFKLLKAGMSQRSVVLLYWGLTLLFGLTAFTLQTRGKLLLMTVLVLVVALLSWMAGWQWRKHV